MINQVEATRFNGIENNGGLCKADKGSKAFVDDLRWAGRATWCHKLIYLMSPVRGGVSGVSSGYFQFFFFYPRINQKGTPRCAPI